MSNDLNTPDQDLAHRLEALPYPGSNGPDTAGIRARAQQRRTRKRIVASAAVFGVLAGASAAAFASFNSADPQFVEAAGESTGDVSENRDEPPTTTAPSEVSTTDGPAESEDGEEVAGPADASTTTTLDNDPDSASDSAPTTTALPTEEEPDTTASSIEIFEGDVPDGLGGVLAIGEDEIVHFRADGDRAAILTARFPSGADQTQFWLHDIAPIDGVPHLLLSSFTFYDFEDFVVTIEMVNLQTDELTVVEERIIKNTDNVEWFYNAHVTTDGSNLLVARELWQGQCYYTETLTPAGVLVDRAQPYPKPAWLEGLDEPTIAEWLNVDWDLIPDCTDLDAWTALGGGPAVLGQQADGSALTELAGVVN